MASEKPSGIKLITIQRCSLFQIIQVNDLAEMTISKSSDWWIDTYTILIEAGNYTEQVKFNDITSNLTRLNRLQVNVTRRGPTYLLGQTSHPKHQPYNTVKIIWAARAETGEDNAFTSTLTVAPNLNASLTGAGTTGFAVPDGTPFGCTDFRTYNIDFINQFAPYCRSIFPLLEMSVLTFQAANPSLAVSISYANGGFYYTGFYSYQDTVNTFPPSSHSTTDFSHRFTLANSAMHISRRARSQAKPISFTVLARPGFPKPASHYVHAAAESQPGKAPTRPS